MRTKRVSMLSLLAGLILVCTQALPAMASAEGSFQRTLTVSGPANIDLTTGSGSVQVRTGDSGKVEITAHIKVTNWLGGDGEKKIEEIEKNPPIQQSGNDIRIGHSDDSELFHNVSISYELVVPAETQLRSRTGSGHQDVAGLRREVEVQTGSGGLKISDIGNTVRAETGSGDVEIARVKGDVRARTGSGTIHANDIGGGFQGNTGSGHITLEQTAPGAVRAETGSGGMDLRGVKGTLEATAGSGTIRADGDPTGSWRVHTGSGGVHLKLASAAAFDLDARTSSGSISVSQPVTVQGSMSKRELRGKVNGGGVSVEVDTGSGDIEIQ